MFKTCPTTPSMLRATTHSDILLRARALKIPTCVIHNASIMNAVGACGLQLYNFGQTVSLVFFTETWKPDSFYYRVRENLSLGMHTLILLDIKVKEQSEENLARSFICQKSIKYKLTSFQGTKNLRATSLYVNPNCGLSTYRDRKFTQGRSFPPRHHTSDCTFEGRRW